MSTISTHILDTATGTPAAGMAVRLERRAGEAWALLGSGVTNGDGRVTDLVPGGRIEHGEHRMVFGTGPWHAAQGVAGFYPEVEVRFVVRDDGHHHVPLLISPFGYSTYRGS
jgi:5-hydroxyisourate hydrolase